MTKCKHQLKGLCFLGNLFAATAVILKITLENEE